MSCAPLAKCRPSAEPCHVVTYCILAFIINLSQSFLCTLYSIMTEEIFVKNEDAGKIPVGIYQCQ